MGKKTGHILKIRFSVDALPLILHKFFKTNTRDLFANVLSLYFDQC